ncbi:molybdenum cofactor guanylyltransferase [Aquirufa nivalisilvae]|uniref:molybdenum cofactor guanylyltransferase n=1 Tax=Aquirufa nivalisilvae TaxID=2516557 RepID=UPI0022A9CEFC|nr:molybdenum cofactor guanylyltransferase [Aquirufa nivalisilvae]MCZ2483180.1 molybdenum cofactor guanylyltransferase [Aquirufa nivalisilvae]
MIGLVMAGGKSLRMGSDKGLLVTKTGEIWAKSAWNKLQSCGIKSYVGINPLQTPSYSPHIPPANIILDHPDIVAPGPIQGILSAHLSYPKEDILVLACDIPNMEISCLQDLMEFRNSQPNALAWVYQNGDQIEPMCAIYSANGLEKLTALLEKKELIPTSLISILNRLQAAIKPVSAENTKNFINCNTPEEIN